MKKNNINFYQVVGTQMPEGKLTTTGIPNDVMSELVTKLQSGKKTKSIQDNLDNAVKKHNDKLVCETIKLFEPINMGVAKLYGNKTERRDVLTLHKQLKDKLPLVIAYLPTYNASLKPTKTGKIFGKVLKPSELLRNLQDVFDAKRKLDREIQYEIQKEAVAKKEREDAELLKKERDAYTIDQKEEMRKKSEAMLKIIRGF